MIPNETPHSLIVSRDEWLARCKTLLLHRWRHVADALSASAWRHAQPFAPPQPVHPLVIDQHSVPTQRLVRQAIAAPTPLPCKLSQALHQIRLVRSRALPITRRRARQTQKAAGLALGAHSLLHQVSCRRFLLGSAYQFFEATSLRQSTSRSRSASSFFRRAFSFSNSSGAAHPASACRRTSCATHRRCSR